MLYDSTKILLQSILHSLETANGSKWDEQNESGKQCLYEMYQMSKPLYKGYKTEGSQGKTAVLVPVSENVNRAIPHVKAMLRAIRLQDRATAIESGKAAITEMNGTSHSRPAIAAVRKTENKELPKELPIVIRQHKKNIAQARPVVKERGSSKRSLAASAH
jgi:hypothetical protein